MRLGELLIEKRLLDPTELDKALALQAARPPGSGEKLGKILSDLGFIAAREVLAALSEQLGLRVVTAAEFPAVTPEVEGLSPRFMRQFRFLPLRVEDSTLTLAMADPLDFETIAAVRLYTGLEVKALLGNEAEIAEALEKYYPAAEAARAGAGGEEFTAASR